MTGPCNRREWMGRIALGTGAALAGLGGGERPCRAGSAEVDGERLAEEAWDFIVRCRRADGGYAPSPDPQYAGESDTKFSDLAAVTYAAVLARTMGRELPQPGRSVDVRPPAPAARRPVRQPRGRSTTPRATWRSSTTRPRASSPCGRSGSDARGRPAAGRRAAAGRGCLHEAALVHDQLLPAALRGAGQAVPRGLAPQAGPAHGGEPGRRRLPGRPRRRRPSTWPTSTA